MNKAIAQDSIKSGIIEQNITKTSYRRVSSEDCLIIPSDFLRNRHTDIIHESKGNHFCTFFIYILDKINRVTIFFQSLEESYSLTTLDMKGGWELHALGTHLLVELRDCNPVILKDLNEVTNVMVAAAKEAKATIINVSFHEFNPFGVSGMVVIAESHLSIHTWPEYCFAAVDIFTCGDVIQPEKAAQFLIDRFESKNPSIVEMKRGLISTNNIKLPHKVFNAEYRMVS